MKEKFVKIIQKKFPKLKFGAITDIPLVTLDSPSQIIEVLDFVKKNKDLRFTILTDLFGADFPNRPKRFEIVYNLLSMELNKRFIIKLHVGEGEEVPSIHEIHSSCVWYQREVFDMYGVEFAGTPDGRRILTDYGFVGHPLRKDFPLSGHLQVRYDEKLGKVIHEQVTLDQDYRNFDFASPWQGPNQVLPGDEKATK